MNDLVLKKVIKLNNIIDDILKCFNPYYNNLL